MVPISTSFLEEAAITYTQVNWNHRQIPSGVVPIRIGNNYALFGRHRATPTFESQGDPYVSLIWAVKNRSRLRRTETCGHPASLEPLASCGCFPERRRGPRRTFGGKPQGNLDFTLDS
jgi:hypothetical protein